MAFFKVTVTNSAGLPLQGVALRLFNGSGTDVTAAQFAASPVYTDASGVFSKYYPDITGDFFFGLPVGVYTCTGSAVGYANASVDTSAFFTGAANLSLTLTTSAVASNVVVTDPVSTMVSGLAPVEFIVPSVNASAAWEDIETSVTASSGEKTQQLNAVMGGSARVNVKAALELESLPWLVGDGLAGIVDPYFTDSFSVTFTSINTTGSQAVAHTLALWAANAYPTAGTNDLTNFTNYAPGGLADWLTPWADDELPKFRGHYADALIWLPAYIGGYSLQIQYMDRNKAEINTVNTGLPDALFANRKAVRIRIPEPVGIARYAQLLVMHGASAQTKPLVVRYHG